MNDDIPDVDGTRVYLKCSKGFVEVDSVRLSADGKYGSPGCELPDGSAIEWTTAYSGGSDPLYDVPLFVPNYYLAFYPPPAYNASYTATLQYKLVRSPFNESIGTVTCSVPAP